MPNIENDETEPDGRRGERTSSSTDEPGDGTGEVVLRASNLQKGYGRDLPLPFTRRVEVLDGADLELRAGELLGVVGENGSGKSTLMKLLVGALPADGGDVTVDGTVGWCPQDPLLYDRLTVAETFRLFGEAHDMTDAEIEAATERYADRLDFAEYLDYQVRHLSGGNRQKVNLGVALMHDPAVLLLDEPYTGFDWETFLAFWELTEELTARGTAVVVISHFVEEHERFDRVLELRDGGLTDVTGEDRVVADGGPDAHRDAASGLRGERDG